MHIVWKVFSLSSPTIIIFTFFIQISFKWIKNIRFLNYEGKNFFKDVNQPDYVDNPEDLKTIEKTLLGSQPYFLHQDDSLSFLKSSTLPKEPLEKKNIYNIYVYGNTYIRNARRTEELTGVHNTLHFILKKQSTRYLLLPSMDLDVRQNHWRSVLSYYVKS